MDQNSQRNLSELNPGDACQINWDGNCHVGTYRGVFSIGKGRPWSIAFDTEDGLRLAIPVGRVTEIYRKKLPSTRRA